jgi:hypothetical protein
MNSTPRHFRPLIFATVVVALAATSGCHWVKQHSWFGHDKGPKYAHSLENRPLEVPPDLTLPDTQSALPMPAANAVGTSAEAPLSGMLLSVSAVDAYPKIAAALEGTPGVVISGRSEALGSFDVTYQGESFLIRVQDRAGGSRLLALSADGQILGGGAAAALMEAIKSKL